MAASSDGAYIVSASRGGLDANDPRCGRDPHDRAQHESHDGVAPGARAGLSENMTARAAVPGAISLTRRPCWPSPF